jgi:hypothetical protein
VVEPRARGSWELPLTTIVSSFADSLFPVSDHESFHIRFYGTQEVEEINLNDIHTSRRLSDSSDAPINFR